MKFPNFTEFILAPFLAVAHGIARKLGVQI